MNSATISCDIISSTALSAEDRSLLVTKLNSLITLFSETFADYGFFGRVTKGDYIECAIKSPEKALRIALLIKFYIKSLNIFSSGKRDKRVKYFKAYGARIAVAVAELTALDPGKNLIDGEAIYLSGRTLQNKETYNKEKIIIKNTLYFLSKDYKETGIYATLFFLLDTLLAKCSSKQSEVVYHKLMGKSEEEICQILNKKQSTINQHSTAAGWNAIDLSVKYFERNIK
jgi:hypothetical protein